MPRRNAPHGRTGRPPVTSRAEILAAARRLLDREGWQKLTIRRLAAELGIGATTLYHHVRDREDLLILLINDHAERTPLPELPEDPRERVVAAATAIHDALAAWPWAAEVLTTDGFLARLGAGRPLTLVENVVAGAVAHGCTHEQAVGVFRDIWYYTVGEILVRARSARRPADFRLASLGDLDPARYPHLATIGDRWPVVAAQDSYRQGLRAFVAGLLTQATGKPT